MTVIRTWMMKMIGRPPAGGIDCHAVGKQLQKYLDGEIDATKARKIEVHLDKCLRCGMEADTYQQIRAALAAHRPEVPRESVERLREFGERLARGEDPSTEPREP